MRKNKFDDANYRILLDKRWSLADLNNFSRLYMQNYAFIYCLEDVVEVVASVGFDHAISEYKLRDGLSYVNIYHIFNRYIPEQNKPIIRAISYASPGFIELILNYEVAVKIAESVTVFLGCFNESYSAYKNLKEIFRNLELRRKEKRNSLLKIEREEIKEVRKLNEELAKGLGYSSLPELYEKVEDPEEVSKLLMAHYRRMKAMSQFVKSGKADFPLE